MKKVMTFVVLVGLLVLGATSVLAATVYFDYMPGGTAEGSSPTGSSSLDCSDYQVGIMVPVKQLQFNLEYSSSDAEQNGQSAQSTNWKITGGYQCFKTDKFELNTDFSYLYWKEEAGGTYVKYSPFLMGVACKYRMNDQMFISGLVDYATPDFLIIKGSTAYPADYTTAQVKYSYLFTKDFAASLGYKWSKLIEHYVFDVETVTKGFTLGACYNF
jgi:hypothetical protein